MPMPMPPKLQDIFGGLITDVMNPPSWHGCNSFRGKKNPSLPCSYQAFPRKGPSPRAEHDSNGTVDFMD